MNNCIKQSENSVYKDNIVNDIGYNNIANVSHENSNNDYNINATDNNDMEENIMSENEYSQNSTVYSTNDVQDIQSICATIQSDNKLNIFICQ